MDLYTLNLLADLLPPVLIGLCLVTLVTCFCYLAGR
jgi:hypothetical protein